MPMFSVFYVTLPARLKTDFDKKGHAYPIYKQIQKKKKKIVYVLPVIFCDTNINTKHR